MMLMLLFARFRGAQPYKLRVVPASGDAFTRALT